MTGILWVSNMAFPRSMDIMLHPRPHAPFAAIQASLPPRVFLDYFVFSRVLYEWSQTVYCLFHVASSTQHHYFVIYPCFACVSTDAAESIQESHRADNKPGKESGLTSGIATFHGVQCSVATTKRNRQVWPIDKENKTSRNCSRHWTY